jgi:hypothetical protein
MEGFHGYPLSNKIATQMMASPEPLGNGSRYLERRNSLPLMQYALYLYNLFAG